MATHAANPSQHTLRLAGATLLCASLLGCSDSMYLGGNVYQECTSPMTCTDVPIVLSATAGGVGASATTKLSPAWTKSVSAQAMIKSAEGGVWLVTPRDSSLVLVKVSEAGELGAETLVAGLAPLADTTSRGRVTSATFHPTGPVVTVEWDHVSPVDFKCPGNQSGQSDASEPVQGKLCHGSSPQTFVFDEANMLAPALIDPCVQGSHAYCHPSTVLRSGDGASLLVVDNEWVKYQTLASVVTDREKLPLDLWGLVGTTTSADGWSLLAGGPISQGTGGGVSGLIDVQRGKPVSAVHISGIDGSGLGLGVGRLFPGPLPGQLIAVVESSALTPTSGGSGTTTRSGDLSVLRIQGRQLISQQVFKREDYSAIRLLAAGVDDVGNAFVATSTGSRDADFAKTLTPLLCRAKRTGDSACFELPAAVSELQATRENLIFVRSGDSLSRFDLAP